MRINICRKLCTVHRNQVTYQFQENEQSLSKKISVLAHATFLLVAKKITPKKASLRQTNAEKKTNS